MVSTIGCPSESWPRILSLLAHPSEIVIKPIEYRFHELRTLNGYIVRRIQEDVPFVSVRCSKLPEEWVLSLVQRKHIVVAPIHHQNRLLHARRKVGLIPPGMGTPRK